MGNCLSCSKCKKFFHLNINETPLKEICAFPECPTKPSFTYENGLYIILIFL